MPNPPEMREKKRRRRTRPHEVDILMSAYLQNAAVSVWFQNRRQAEKKRSQRYGGSGASPALSGAQRLPVQTFDLAHLHGLRDLHELVGPLPGAARQGAMRRATSSPCISLTTDAAGHAQLGPSAPAPEPVGDIDIWQRMESSSAVNSSSDVEDADADARGSQDEDEEEMTLRRLAQRRARKRDAPDASDARNMMHARRPSAARPLKRQASLSLEFAAARETSPPSSAKPLRRTESMPVRAPLQPVQPPAAAPVAPMARPLHVPRKPTALDALRLAQDKENAPPRLPRARPLSAFRRVASAGSRAPRECALWPRTPSIPVTRRESSARSDAAPVRVVAPLKAEEHDDSGFFEEESQAHSSPASQSSAKSMPVGHFTEHDRQAVELLLGLGSIPVGHA
ncbi:hypothetical protein CBS9595_001595 [Malassezia furfur]|nr:hypothetical protein CBS9595_001595 [Malassezia furfur]